MIANPGPNISGSGALGGFKRVAGRPVDAAAVGLAQAFAPFSALVFFVFLIAFVEVAIGLFFVDVVVIYVLIVVPVVGFVFCRLGGLGRIVFCRDGVGFLFGRRWRVVGLAGGLGLVILRRLCRVRATAWAAGCDHRNAKKYANQYGSKFHACMVRGARHRVVNGVDLPL